MFGGQISTSNVELLVDKELIMAVFSNQFYAFHIHQMNIMAKINLSQNLIKSWKFDQSASKLVAVDETGNVIEVTFGMNCKNKPKNIQVNQWLQEPKIQNKKITNKITNVQIVHVGFGQYKVYFIQNGSLFQYFSGSRNLLAKNAAKILYTDTQHIIFLPTQSNLEVRILSTIENQQKNIKMSSPITAAIIKQATVILGDEKGKIYVYRDYLNIQQNKIATKLEWHVHKVNNLCLQGEYLYSCGQQGTVVMWHLRQNKRDFLPRIGTEILKVKVQAGVVICILADNTISSIDLNQDKQLKAFKTVINPWGYLTKSIKQKSYNGKIITMKNNDQRNLMVLTSIAGSIQLLDLNDSSNRQIQILPRNLISRLDEYYPEPHEIIDTNFNKEWTLMACSTYGVNHNTLHFYKNQGYNLQFKPISRVNNPHQGPANILCFNNTFITFTQNQQTVRFWDKVKQIKKSIIEKEEEYFVCSGEINYRKKPIFDCVLLHKQSLLSINYGDQILIINLKSRKIVTGFRSKQKINKIELTMNHKGNHVILFLVSDKKISFYQLNKSSFQIQKFQVIYNLSGTEKKQIKITKQNGQKIAFLIRTLCSQYIVEFDLRKNQISDFFQNLDQESIQIFNAVYHRKQLVLFSSNLQLCNLSNPELNLFQFLTSPTPSHRKQSDMQTQMMTEHLENENYEFLHKNYIDRTNIRNKGEIADCLEKMQLGMFPSLSFGFGALSDKMFY